MKTFLSMQSRQRSWRISLAIALSGLVFAAQARSADVARAPGGSWPLATLQAQASATVRQDVVRIVLASEVTGATQAAVAKDLGERVGAALGDARKTPGVNASSGDYHVWPVTDKAGKITTWRGRGEIVLESTDFAAASQLAGRLSDRLSVVNLAFSVSPARRGAEESRLLQDAVRAFRARAQALAAALGFDGYRIREVQLHDGGGYRPVARTMAAPSQADVPLGAGTEMITVSLQGTIFLRSAKK
ncbi:MAG: DUF541 domain-containing protein [Candidimonas sp.]|nr:MAG: DUF541 domain-containing protein [Candidimonas sp.]